MTLNETPSANRLHIGIFGKTNSRKSSLINAFAKQDISIVSDVAGTTTDPVYKAMEIYPLGPCVLIDTAGFADTGELGEQRMEKTRLAAEKTEIAVVLFSEEASGENMDEELSWCRLFASRKVPVIPVVSKWDLCSDGPSFLQMVREKTGEEVVCLNAKTGEGISELREALAKKLPEGRTDRLILGDLVNPDDLVLLVMPQDIQAPKGRLILPQVQTLRELLDRKCLAMSVTTDRLLLALEALSRPPKLIVTDSQVFSYVYEHKPAESLLTSFSVLFAAYKGDLLYYLEGAAQIDALTPSSRVLIAECCTHAPLKEDIGREKLPAMLRKRVGKDLTVDVVSGTDFPQDLSAYDLIIQCGACMFNRKYVMLRIDRAREQGIPMTNYGVAIAHLSGILGKIAVVGL